jgi:hypothetical protein
LQRRVGILYRHHRYRYKFDYPASSVAAYTKAAFIAALEVAELLFTMVSVTGTGVTIPSQAPGSARHLYVICIYGAICLQISKINSIQILLSHQVGEYIAIYVVSKLVLKFQNFFDPQTSETSS